MERLSLLWWGACFCVFGAALWSALVLFWKPLLSLFVFEVFLSGCCSVTEGNICLLLLTAVVPFSLSLDDIVRGLLFDSVRNFSPSPRVQNVGVRCLLSGPVPPHLFLFLGP